jgi:hypothetical protein
MHGTLTFIEVSKFSKYTNIRLDDYSILRKFFIMKVIEYLDGGFIHLPIFNY